ncbi:hypothetical protein OEV98_01760 [Caldibacillus lycopersici]|uniref:Abortive phage infection protein n=1 Tax=Perspicuibacillus lycopersici TaxID=1325689 RepID=A0AAE3IQE3_9BACI|nr:hypothetical protein [Perspicuibacillus lycopersici]MCU9612287.1 hypothetical protein [Perspicuibacillus lycopersici]
MDEQTAISLQDKLKNGEIEELFISKEEFLSFRKSLTQRDDFKHFRGVAQRGGDVIYYYMKEARS